MLMSFKTNRAKGWLSFKSERLWVRKKFKKCLDRKADSVSKNLMGKDGLTGDLTGSPDG